MFSDYINEFWAKEFFGCSMEVYKNNVNIVCDHQFWKDYTGAFILEIYNKKVFSVASNYINVFKEMSKEKFNLEDRTFIEKFLKEYNIKYIAPSWLGYVSENIKYEYPTSTQIIDLSIKENCEALEIFKNSCDETEWSHGGINENSELIAVQYCDGIIVAGADYHLWGKKIAHIGIITHPLYRKRGYAKNVLACISDNIIKRNLVPQYRTLCSNIGSIKTSEKCGYKQYATHISIRMNVEQ